MKSFFSKSIHIGSIILTIFLNSCNKDNMSPNPMQGGKLVYITNEGAYGHNNGSVSILEPDSNRITNYIFENANGKNTGDIIQSIGFANQNGYIIANNNNLVKVVNLSSFKEIAELEISYPRYFLEIDTTKAYISSGKYKGSLKIINLQSNTITDSIVVGTGPNKLVKSGNYVFVANNGGWSSDSTVSVKDYKTNNFIKNVIVGNNPNDMVVDYNGDIWVICSDIHANSKIVKINHNSLSVEKSFTEGFANMKRYESKLIAISNDKKTIYFQDSLRVFSYTVNSSVTTVDTFISTNALYGLNVDSSNGDIYCIEAGNYSSGGIVTIYNKNGAFKNKFTAGVGTNGAYFNY